MKSLYRLMFLLTAFPSFSQNWCPPGAIWYYAMPSNNATFSTGVVELKYSGDTTINSIVAKIIRGTFIGRFYSTPVVNPHFLTFITYESNNVVYLFNGSSFDTVVNYKASIGDHWQILRQSNFCDKAKVTVTDTGHVTINNFSLRKIITVANYTTNAWGDTINGGYTCIHTEKLDNNYGPYVNYPLFPILCPPDVGQEHPIYYLCSYKDDNFPIYVNAGGYCNGITATSEESVTDNKIKIYPNPSQGRVFIELNAAGEIMIFDVYGTLVVQVSYPEKGIYTLDLEGLSKGVYYLRVKGGLSTLILNNAY